MSLSATQSTLVNNIADTICDSFSLEDDQRDDAHALMVDKISPLVLAAWPAPSQAPKPKRKTTKNAYQLFLSSLSTQRRDEREAAKSTMSAEEFENYVSPLDTKIEQSGGKLFHYASTVWKEIKNTPEAQRFHDEAASLREAAGKEPVKQAGGGGKRPKNAYNLFCMHYTGVRKGTIESEDHDHYMEVLEQCDGKIQKAQSTIWKEIKGTPASEKFVTQAAAEKEAYEARNATATES